MLRIKQGSIDIHWYLDDEYPELGLDGNKDVLITANGAELSIIMQMIKVYSRRPN